MESQENSLGIQQFLLILKRRWLPATVEFVLICSAAIAAMFLIKPVYVAEGKLLLKKASSTPSLTGLGKEIGNLDPLNSQGSALDTEAEILLSIPITQSTIAKLNLKDPQGVPLKPNQFLNNLSVSKIESTDILKVAYKDTDPKRAAVIVNTLIDTYLASNIHGNRAETKAARQFIENQLPEAEATVRQADLALRLNQR
jgi:polysaccharide biosynthesis transport protein